MVVRSTDEGRVSLGVPLPWFLAGSCLLFGRFRPANLLGGRGGNAFLMGFWGLSGGTGCWVCEGGEFFCVQFLERRGKSRIDLFFPSFFVFLLMGTCFTFWWVEDVVIGKNVGHS